MSGLELPWQGAPRTLHAADVSAAVPDSPLAGCTAYSTPPRTPRVAALLPHSRSGLDPLTDYVVGLVRGAGGLCMAAAAGAVLLLLLALLLLPSLSDAGVEWTAVAAKPRAAAQPNATSDSVSAGAAKQSRIGFRWPLQGSRQAAGVGTAGRGGSAADGSPQGGVPCADGCEDHGNCNWDSGRCECPFGRAGAACEVAELPACRLADNPDGQVVCPFEHDAPRAVACACHLQCAQYLLELGEELDYPAALQDASTAGCFTRIALPPEQQWSDIPAAGQQDVKYFHGVLDGSPEVEREEVAVSDGRQQLPLSDCPGNCSHAGSCTQAAGTDEPPTCRCLWQYTGADCSGRAHEGDSIMNPCPGNCSRVGRCLLGFCRCPPGRWGADCSRSRAWAPQPQRPAALLRIFVYDLPFALDQMHAARQLHTGGTYLAYLAFYRMLLAGLGGDRTENPYEASLFLIPAQTFQWSENLGFVRAHHLRTVQWVARSFPFWNASGGADHLLWWPNDQGAAYSHYNRFPDGEGPEQYRLLEAPVKATHFCYSGPGADDGSLRSRYGQYGQQPWPSGYAFQPTRDVCVAPSSFEVDLAATAQETYRDSPQDAAPLRADADHLPLGNRSTLLYFLGSTPSHVQDAPDMPDTQYSSGARQALLAAHSGTPGFRVSNGSELDPPLRGDDDEQRDAVFCFAPTGHGFGMRLLDAVVHGCIPVIVQDEVTQYFEDVLPYTAFSVRVPQCDIPRLDAILRSVPQREVALLQWGLVDYHRAFLWRPPYGLAYNYTIASLQRSLANRRAASALFSHTSWRSWLRNGSGGGAS